MESRLSVIENYLEQANMYTEVAHRCEDWFRTFDFLKRMENLESSQKRLDVGVNLRKDEIADLQRTSRTVNRETADVLAEMAKCRDDFKKTADLLERIETLESTQRRLGEAMTLWEEEIVALRQAMQGPDSSESEGTEQLEGPEEGGGRFE